MENLESKYISEFPSPGEMETVEDSGSPTGAAAAAPGPILQSDIQASDLPAKVAEDSSDLDPLAVVVAAEKTEKKKRRRKRKRLRKRRKEKSRRRTCWIFLGQQHKKLSR